ncbi:MAG: hypothetical protein ACK4U0_21940 [Mesorhizobium sp.]
MDVGLDELGLRRVAALLVALAALADRAAGRSVPVRWFVLALLRYTERIVSEFVADATGWNLSGLAEAHGVGDDLDGPLGSGNGPADAVALAWRLRSLAAMLGALLPAEDLPVRAEIRSAGALRRLASLLALPLAMAGGLSRPAPDTS